MRCAGVILRAFVALPSGRAFLLFGIKANIGSVGKGDQKMTKPMDWRAARDLLLERAVPVSTETVSLDNAAGRISAAPTAALREVPPFDRSPFDGYAFRSADTAGELPVTLTILEEVPAGAVPTRTVTSGTAVKILTGAPIPPGADAVSKFEETDFTPETVTLKRAYQPGENLICRGEDVHVGMELTRAGQTVDAGVAGALWSQGVDSVLVYRRPRVAVITTGSELEEGTASPTEGRIPNSNRPAFETALRLAGAEPVYYGTPKDDCAAIAALLERALKECDMVLTTGGVSVGDYDLTPAALECAGAEIAVRNIGLKPGGKCCFGWKNGKFAACLSGNPASALTCFYAVALPVLRRLCGREQAALPEVSARLGADFKKGGKQTRLVRGRLSADEHGLVFYPAAQQGNGALHTLAGANALAEIPSGAGPQSAGAMLRVSYFGI